MRPRQAGMTLSGSGTWKTWENDSGTRAILADLGPGFGAGPNHTQALGTFRLGYEQIFGNTLFLSMF